MESKRLLSNSIIKIERNDLEIDVDVNGGLLTEPMEIESRIRTGPHNII